MGKYQPYQDCHGKTYGFLTIIGDGGRNKDKQQVVIARCVCGTAKSVRLYQLKQGVVKSCGCKHYELIVLGTTKHGLTKNKKRPPEYNCWSGMKARCYYLNHPEYHLYGGRGISVCERWRNSFENFLSDIGSRPSKYHSVDRFPDKNGNYEPANCRWATQRQQAGNTRTNRWIEYGGRTMILADWAREIEISAQHLRALLLTHSFSSVYKKYKTGFVF